MAGSIEFSVAEVDDPVRCKEEAVEEVDSQHPIEGSERELRGDPAKVSSADQGKELPTRTDSGLGAVGFVGIHRPREAEADEHSCFQEFCDEHRGSDPF